MLTLEIVEDDLVYLKYSRVCAPADMSNTPGLNIVAAQNPDAQLAGF